MLDAILSNFWFITWFGLWWKFMIAEVILEIIMVYIMFKYIIRMSDGNLETARRILDERKSREKVEKDIDDEATAFDAVKAIILFLFPIIAFIYSSISLVRDLSSYERFVAWCEK